MKSILWKFCYISKIIVDPARHKAGSQRARCPVQGDGGDDESWSWQLEDGMTVWWAAARMLIRNLIKHVNTSQQQPLDDEYQGTWWILNQHEILNMLKSFVQEMLGMMLIIYLMPPLSLMIRSICKYPAPAQSMSHCHTIDGELILQLLQGGIANITSIRIAENSFCRSIFFVWFAHIFSF